MSISVKVGSFAKTTGAATVAQAVTGVGFVPKALILWTTGGTVDGTLQTQATLDSRSSVGIVSGTATANQFCGGSVADTAGSGGTRASQRAICLLNAAGAVVSQCVLQSFDADGFTLSWTTNAVGEAQIINYIAFGGTELQAAVVEQTTPGATGNFATTGVGFQPNLLFAIGTATGGLGYDVNTTNNSLRSGFVNAAGSRFTTSMCSAQAAGSQGWRVHRTERFLVQLAANGGSTLSYDWISMDADGFTLNQIAGISLKLGVLALRVPASAIGTITKPTGAGPVAGSITGLTFQPSLVILSGDMDITRGNNGTNSQTGARWGLSAYTASDARAAVLSIPDAPTPLTFGYINKSAKAALKIDNAPPTLQAECTGALNADGFTLTWNANDAVATEYGYLAIGDETPRPPQQWRRPIKASGGANVGRKQRGAWRRRSG